MQKTQIRPAAKLYNQTQAAQMLSVTRGTIYNWVQAGSLTADVRHGVKGSPKFLLSTLQQFADDHGITLNPIE